MKYLLNSNFKIIRKGSHVKANDSAGEFIFDDEDVSNFTMGMMEEIAKSNKLRDVGGKTKSKLLTTLKEALEKMENVAEQNGPTETEIAEEIIREGFEEGLDDETMMMQMVQQGVSFKRTMKLFKQVAADLGFLVTTKDVKEKAGELLAELNFDPETYDHVQDMLAKIREATGGTEKQAISAIRTYAKENEIALPKKVKQKGAGGYVGRVHSWIVENPNADETELAQFLESLGKDPEKTTKRFVSLIKLCQRYAEANAHLYVDESAA